MGVRRVATALFILLGVAGLLAARTVGRDLEPAAPATARTTPLPLMFEPDPDGGGFVARSRGYSAHIQDGEVRLVGRGAGAAAVTLRFAGGAGDLRPEREMSTTVSSFADRGHRGAPASGPSPRCGSHRCIRALTRRSTAPAGKPRTTPSPRPGPAPR